MLLEVLGAGSFSRKHIVYDKAAGRGAAGLNGVVDSRPLPQAVGFGPFCAEPQRSKLRASPSGLGATTLFTARRDMEKGKDSCEPLISAK